MLNYLCSGNIVFVDLFFKTHELTKHRSVSPQLKQLLMKMLAFSPEKRPTLESLLDEDEWLNGGCNG
jgi:serine/threonine protein kinase